MGRIKHFSPPPRTPQQRGKFWFDYSVHSSPIYWPDPLHLTPGHPEIIHRGVSRARLVVQYTSFLINSSMSCSCRPGAAHEKRLSLSPATPFSDASLPNHTKMFELVHVVTSMDDFGTQRGEVKGVLSWLVRLACRAGTKDFCCAWLL